MDIRAAFTPLLCIKCGLQLVITEMPSLSQTSTMNSLPILGYADTKPTRISVDCANPQSLVSVVFLFRNALSPHLHPTGYNYAQLTMLIPSQGGYYVSSDMRLVASSACAADIVLGADWTSTCRVSLTANGLSYPVPETIQRLPEGHGWTADGKMDTL